MDGIASITNVGAGASLELIQFAAHMAATRIQLEASSDVAVNALKLIQSAVVDSSMVYHDLDVVV